MDNESTDRYLAIHLLGWEPHEDYTWWRKKETSARLPNGEPVYAEYYTGYVAPGANPLVPPLGTKGFWHPSTNITQALGDGGEGTVVGKLKELGWFITSLHEMPNLEKPWTCHLMWPRKAPYTKESLGTGNTPAAAITDAAVRALGGE